MTIRNLLAIDNCPRLRPRPPQRTSGILVLWLNQETVHQRSLAVSSGTVDIHRTISNPSNASLDPPFTALSPSAWHHIFILHTSPHVQSPPITCIDTNQEKHHTHTVLFNHSSQGPSPTGISMKNGGVPLEHFGYERLETSYQCA